MGRSNREMEALATPQQLPNGCSANAPPSVVVVNGLIRSDLFLIIVQGIMTLSVILNYYGIYYHVARVEMVDDETKTRQQREKLAYRRDLLISIIAVPPVACATAFIITFAPRLNLYLDFIRIIVFAKSMNSLFNLIMEYFGGFDSMLRKLRNKQWHLNVFICKACPCLPVKQTHKAWFNNLWWGAYQPVFLRMALTTFNCLIVAEGIYKVDTLALNTVLTNLISTSFGVYCLSVISENVQEDLSNFDIRGKFLMFRLALLCINIQPIVLGFIRFPCVFPFTAPGRSTVFHNQLLILEMFGLALWQRHSFIYNFNETDEIASSNA